MLNATREAPLIVIDFRDAGLAFHQSFVFEGLPEQTMNLLRAGISKSAYGIALRVRNPSHQSKIGFAQKRESAFPSKARIRMAFDYLRSKVTDSGGSNKAFGREF